MLSSAPEQAGAQLFKAGFHWFIRTRMNTQPLSHTQQTQHKLDLMFTSGHLYSTSEYVWMQSVVFTILDLNANMQISVHPY